MQNIVTDFTYFLIIKFFFQHFYEGVVVKNECRYKKTQLLLQMFELKIL